MKKPNGKLFKEVCEKKAGNITEIAKAFCVERKTIYRWIEKDPKFKEILDDVNESILDLAESQLINLIKGIPKTKEEKGRVSIVGWIERPSESAMKYILSMKGKKRGYDGSLGVNIQFERMHESDLDKIIEKLMNNEKD